MQNDFERKIKILVKRHTIILLLAALSMLGLVAPWFLQLNSFWEHLGLSILWMISFPAIAFMFGAAIWELSILAKEALTKFKNYWRNL